MSARFHIASNGRPAPCTATQRSCPLGADAPHFDSAAEAAQWSIRKELGMSQPVPVAAPEPAAVDVRQLQQDMADAVAEQQDAARELAAISTQRKAYDSLYGAAEGRAYYYDYSKGYDKIRGVNPSGSTYFDPHPDFQARLDAARAKQREAFQKEADAQTALELAGKGHLIPDDGNTIRVRTQAQKWLLKDELQGQISDGYWENASGNPWQDWSGAKVVVDPKNPGRNFFTRKDNYQLNARALLDVVGDRMVENVRQKTGESGYGARAMNEDLKDLRNIFKTKRGKHVVEDAP